MKIRIGINGFGRIGRMVTRMLAEDNRFELRAINDLHDQSILTHLLKYDSVHGRPPFNVSSSGGRLSAGIQNPVWMCGSDPAKLNWAEVGVDLVIECTGAFKSLNGASGHLTAGARKVVISAPPADDHIKTIVLGVNDNLLLPGDTIVSCASCTTNSAAPMIKVLDELCGIQSCYITTVHSYTGDQRLHDAPHSDPRRARAGALSIVPTSTGAAKALIRIFPHLAADMGGCGIRVPVPDGSLTDITCTVDRLYTTDRINNEFAVRAKTDLRGILEFTSDPIVSVDVIGNRSSCLFDSLLTSVVGRMVKVVGWYDNEVGYSARLLDLAVKMGS